MKLMIFIVTIILVQGCSSNSIYPKKQINNDYPLLQFSQNYKSGTFDIRSCSDLESCSLNIMLRVRSKAKWICDKKSNNKEVSILANISRDGLIINTVISDSSDDAEFDGAALEAVMLSAPFTELSNLNDDEFNEASEIIFRFTGNKPIIEDSKSVRNYNNKSHVTQKESNLI